MWAPACHSMCVEVREQVAWVAPLLLPYRSQRPNLMPSNSGEDTFTCCRFLQELWLYFYKCPFKKCSYWKMFAWPSNVNNIINKIKHKIVVLFYCSE